MFQVGTSLAVINIVSFGYYLVKYQPRKEEMGLRVMSIALFIFSFLTIAVGVTYWIMLSQFPK